jgi:hypothetical protein
VEIAGPKPAFASADRNACSDITVAGRPETVDPLPEVSPVLPVPVLPVLMLPGVVTPFMLLDDDDTTAATPQVVHENVVRLPPVTISICRSLSGLAALAKAANSGDTKSPQTAVLMCIDALHPSQGKSENARKFAQSAVLRAYAR